MPATVTTRPDEGDKITRISIQRHVEYFDFDALLEIGIRRRVSDVAKVAINLPPLLYGGTLNELHGPPGSGKSQTATSIIVDATQKKQRVLVYAPEETGNDFASRFLSLGGNINALRRRGEDAQSLVRVIPRPKMSDWNAYIQEAAEFGAAIIAIDGLAKLMAQDGKNEDKQDDIIQFLDTRFRPFADTGAAVLISDHVPKSSTGYDRWPRGGSAKLGEYDGSVYYVGTGKPFTPTRAGYIKLLMCKDRHGSIGVEGQIIADLHFIPTGNFLQIPKSDEIPLTQFQFRAHGKDAYGADWIPTMMMERVSRQIEENPESGAEDLRGLGGAATVDWAVRILIERGHIKKSKKGRKNCYEILQKFREPVASTPETEEEEDFQIGRIRNHKESQTEAA